MHKITCYGTYLTKTASGTIEQEEYEGVEFNLDLSAYPEEHKTSMARSIIHNTLIADALKKKDKGYKSFRECQIEEITPVDGDSSLDPEIQELLDEAISKGCVPPNYSTYKSDPARKRRLREALKAHATAVQRAEKKKSAK